MGETSGAYLVAYVLGVFVAWAIGSSKGKAGTGFLLGLLFSWLGALFALLLTPTGTAAAKLEGRRPCPYCAEQILPEAKVCPHCHRDVVMLPTPESASDEGWLPDPSGRHPDRWWNGSSWTEWVRDKPGGTRSEDPPVMSAS